MSIPTYKFFDVFVENYIILILDYEYLSIISTMHLPLDSMYFVGEENFKKYFAYSQISITQASEIHTSFIHVFVENHIILTTNT